MPNPNTETAVESSRGEMGFFDHLEDLRKTIVKCVLAYLFFAVVLSVFLKEAAAILHWPLTYALGEEAMANGGLLLTSPMGIFTVIIQIVLLGGLALALPVMLYFVAQFVAPALTPKELRILRPACLAVFILFMVGALFSFFVLVPTALKAAKGLSDMLQFQSMWTADKYYSLVAWMTLGVGSAFEFPLILLILVYAGVLSSEKLKAFRRYSVVVFLIGSALLTPTSDPITFLLLAVPLQILYEGATYMATHIEKWKRKEAEAAAEEL